MSQSQAGLFMKKKSSCPGGPLTLQLTRRAGISVLLVLLLSWPQTRACTRGDSPCSRIWLPSTRRLWITLCGCWLRHKTEKADSSKPESLGWPLSSPTLVIPQRSPQPHPSPASHRNKELTQGSQQSEHYSRVNPSMTPCQLAGAPRDCPAMKKWEENSPF